MYLLQRKLIALLFLVAAALVVAQPAGAARRDFVGISSEDAFHASSSYRSRTFGQQRGVGVQLLRQNFDWAAVERSPGRYSFREYDSYVGAAAAHGLRILPVLYHPPGFRSRRPRRGAQRGEYPPNSFRAMGAFGAAVVRRYGPRGSFWRSHPSTPKVPIRAYQVWNEPSLPVYWRPRPSARSYVRLLKTVRRAIRRADRHAEIVTAGIPPSKLRGAIRLTRFLKGMYRAGGRRAFTTFAVNSYAKNSRDLSRTLHGLRRIMRRYHDRRKRMWITELGWATGGPRHRFNIGAAGQARRIKSVLRWVRRNRRKLRIRGVVYFQWRDQPPYPPAYKDMWGLHTGLLDRAGRAKPGLATFASSARRLH
jgi:polysaccharide biosynthesis protein PslG